MSPPRVDAHGDPLPDAALARLGATRFRVGGNPDGTALSPDAKLIAVLQLASATTAA